MSEILPTLLKVALVSGIILGSFWLYKHSTRATIENGDVSMDRLTFPEGGYSVDTSSDSIAKLKAGDFVAYKLPKEPTTVQIARVVAVEGNTVSYNGSDLIVDGAKYSKHYEISHWTIPETKVPRGCVYVLGDNPAAPSDSKSVGPVPFTHVLGTVQPSH